MLGLLHCQNYYLTCRKTAGVQAGGKLIGHCSTMVRLKLLYICNIYITQFIIRYLHTDYELTKKKNASNAPYQVFYTQNYYFWLYCFFCYLLCNTHFWIVCVLPFQIYVPISFFLIWRLIKWTLNFSFDWYKIVV